MAVPLLSPGSPVSLRKVALEQPAMSITGSIDGLVAGAPAGLTLTLHSTADAASQVHNLSASVSRSPAGCPANALEITPWSGHLVVPAHGHSAATLSIRLRPGTVGCAGATWALVYVSS